VTRGHEHREGLPAELAQRLNLMASRHGAIRVPETGRGPADHVQSVLTSVQDRLKTVLNARADASAACPVSPANDVAEWIRELASNMGVHLGLYATVRSQADQCEKKDTCSGLLPTVRVLADAGKFTEAEAEIAQAKKRQCDLGDAQDYLDYQRTLRDGRRVILNAVAQCQFTDAIALAEKMPLSFRQQSEISNAAIDARRGRAAELEVERRLQLARDHAAKAAEALRASRCSDADAEFAEVDHELAQADVAMSNFACLKPRIDAVRSALAGLKTPCGSAPPPPPPPGRPGAGRAADR
jgi:hypothetical protein